MLSQEAFQLNQVLETDDLGDIHYNMHLPDAYDGSKTYALHVALPGWEGLYPQGIGADLQWEYVPRLSTAYVADMLVVSLQLDDWGDRSAYQVIRLTEHLMDHYAIDETRLYITGYSAGGETLSRVLGLRPDLYRATLFVSSRWAGDITRLVQAKVPLYMFTSEHDAYYTAEPVKEAWQDIHDAYRKIGISEADLDELLVLDIREDQWFDEMIASRGETMYANGYHGAGMLVAYDARVMRWVFENKDCHVMKRVSFFLALTSEPRLFHLFSFYAMIHYRKQCSHHENKEGMFMDVRLLKQAFIKFFIGLGLMGGLLFLSAGTFTYPQAWLLLGILFIPMFCAGMILMYKNPDLLRKRLTMKEDQDEQKMVVALSGLLFVLVFLVSGLTVRFGWWQLPLWVSYVSAVLFLCAYALYGEVLRENVYLSRSVEVQENQKVIDTGLYGIVRHPMYMSTILLFLSMPLVLGSLYAFLLMFAYLPLIEIRMKNEEAVLEEGLAGYRAYKQRVRFKVIPFIW